MRHTRPASFLCGLTCAITLLIGSLPGRAEDGGSRRFDRSVPLEDSAATSANVSIGDVNADGHQDIVLVKGRHWPLEDLVLLGDGHGSFQRAYPLGGQPDRSYSGVLVDVDGDGDLDVVVSNDTPDAKIVHLNDGRGRFVAGPTFGRKEWSTRHISVVDLNGDALPDVVLANRYGNKPGPSYVCFGKKGGKFADECVAFAQGSATTIKPADVNADGAPDLVVPHRDEGQSFIYLNDGKGGFGERRPFGPSHATIRSAEPADLNADGVKDLVVIDEQTGPAIFWGRADGTYSAAEGLGPRGATPYALAVADLDRNGRADVIVGHVKSRPVVYFNDGPGIFHAVPFGDNEGTAYGFSVGDLDEDGFLDIAMARSEARNMLYFGAPVKAKDLVEDRRVPTPFSTAAAHSGLRMAISSRPPTTGLPGEPEFDIGIENVGNDDVVLNLGCMLANGKVMFPEAVRLLLSDAQGNTRELLYSDTRYPGIAGRVDDFIVSLRAGSVYTIRVSMDQYWSPSTNEWDLTVAPGQYRIEARFEGQGARFLNLDIRGIGLLNFWKGTLRSNALTFEVP